MSLLQKGIRRRWMLNSIGTVFLVLLVAMISFSVFVGNYYYNSMRSALQTQASAVSDFFSSYATSERTYLEMANYYINDFDERESLELQFISTSGKIVLSSYGLTSGGSPGTNDIAQSIKTRDVSAWSGRDPSTSERIMAVSAPILYRDEVKGAVRLVSQSLHCGPAVYVPHPHRPGRLCPRPDHGVRDQPVFYPLHSGAP